MRILDSVDKIVSVYLGAVTCEKFSFRGKTYSPKPIYVSELIFRRLLCPSGCGACCGRFSLDYIPTENWGQVDVNQRVITISGTDHTIMSLEQKKGRGSHCEFLDPQARCTIYGNRPLSCSFETIRFINNKSRWLLMNKGFGRGWAMRKSDGELGALCDFVKPDISAREGVKAELKRLESWALYLRIKTRIPKICAKLDSLDEPSSFVIC